MEAKKQLRSRWKDSGFLKSLPIENQSIRAELLNDLDLQGVANLGCGEPLWKFPEIFSTEIHNLDLSYGDGAVVVSESKITELKCVEFKFDQASFFRKSTFSDSAFTKARLKFNAGDVEFRNCDFSESTFKGGFREYGFRRCTFFGCKFSLAQWQNMYMFACRFVGCDFTDFQISKSLVRGFKVDELTEAVSSIFANCCEVTGLVEE